VYLLQAWPLLKAWFWGSRYIFPLYCRWSLQSCSRPLHVPLPRQPCKAPSSDSEPWWTLLVGDLVLEFGFFSFVSLNLSIGSWRRDVPVSAGPRAGSAPLPSAALDSPARCVTLSARWRMTRASNCSTIDGSGPWPGGFRRGGSEARAATGPARRPSAAPCSSGSERPRAVHGGRGRGGPPGARCACARIGGASSRCPMRGGGAAGGGGRVPAPGCLDSNARRDSEGRRRKRSVRRGGAAP